MIQSNGDMDRIPPARANAPLAVRFPLIKPSARLSTVATSSSEAQTSERLSCTLCSGSTPSIREGPSYWKKDLKLKPVYGGGTTGQTLQPLACSCSGAGAGAFQ